MTALYSFDVFDTLIQRATLEPRGVFFRVRELMRASNLGFPIGLIEDYPNSRMGAESNVRYAFRSTFFRSREISFDSIFLRLSGVYNLNDEQVDFLKSAELQCEFEACEPCANGLGRLFELRGQGHEVIMISDMYLPEYFVRTLLNKVEPRLDGVPLYISSTVGVQKITGEVFEFIAKDRAVDFAGWTHYGDNQTADGTSPAKFGIKTIVHPIPEFNLHEQRLVSELGSYDGYCCAALMARYRFNYSPSIFQEFTYNYVSGYLVTYIFWVLSDAINRGIQSLYFIARDGYHLKRIADTIIEEQGLNISTHYLYGSRKVWWVPSFIDKIDDEFFIGLESLKASCSLDDLLDALCLDMNGFLKLCPQFSDRNPSSNLSCSEVQSVVLHLKGSEEYKKYILELSASDRSVVCAYLLNTVNVDQCIAFVEYWGRGFTQTCLGRLLSFAHGRQVETKFYYARSIYQDDPSAVRYNFTASKESLLHVERLFANSPTGTVTSYRKSENAIQAVTALQEYAEDLFIAMEESLPRFALDLCRVGFFGRIDSLRMIFDWAIRSFQRDLSEEVVWRSFAHLKDVNRNFGREMEYAPCFNMKTIWHILNGREPETASKDVSLKRSHWIIRILFRVVQSLR